MKLSKPRLRRDFFFSIAAEKGRCIDIQIPIHYSDYAM